MKLVVCIKTVPDTAQLRYDAQGHLAMDQVEWVMNPFCEYALETAVRMKEAIGESATLTVFSLGPVQAKEAIKKALAVGADEAYLLSDDRLKGGCGWTVSHALSQAIKTYAPEAKAIFFGQFASDGSSGMVGPGVAQLMEVPSITFCKGVTIEGDRFLAERETEKGLEKYRVQMPAVLCMMKCDYELRMPAIKGVMKANRMEIPEVKLEDIGLTPDQVGPEGSLTQVTEVLKKPKKEGGRKIDGSDPTGAVQQIVDYLKAQQVV